MHAVHPPNCAYYDFYVFIKNVEDNLEDTQSEIKQLNKVSDNLRKKVDKINQGKRTFKKHIYYLACFFS